MKLQESIHRIKEIMGIHEQKTNEVQNQLEWLRSYVKSPMYLERLKKEFAGKDQKFIENERNTRLKNLDNAEYRTKFVNSIGKHPGSILGFTVPKKYEGMVYDYPSKTWVKNEYQKNSKGYDTPGNVYLEKGYDKYKGYENIPAHEYGHLVDDNGYRIPKSTKQKIYNYTTQTGSDKNYKSGNLEYDYVPTPSEFTNRFIALKYLLKKLNIYDASTNIFTENDYNKMMNNPTIKNDSHFQDIFYSLKGNDAEKKKYFMDLMNSVAIQSNPKNTNLA